MGVEKDAGSVWYCHYACLKYVVSVGCSLSKMFVIIKNRISSSNYTQCIILQHIKIRLLSSGLFEMCICMYIDIKNHLDILYKRLAFILGDSLVD